MGWIFLFPSLYCYVLRNGLQITFPATYNAFLNITFRDALPCSPRRYERTNRAQFLSYAPQLGRFLFMLSSLPSSLPP